VEEETIVRSSPTVEIVDVASVWDATEEPLRDVIVPPAPPASVPQVNVPFDQRSFSVDALHAESDAPKRAARVRPPVEEALTKERALVVRPVVEALPSTVWPETVRAVAEAVERVLCPEALKVEVKRLFAVKIEEDALVSVVCPVTLSVEEKDPMVPMSAP
jgi:hypothetical protein